MIKMSKTATLKPSLLAVFEDGRKHPAVIILPGGGYVYTTPYEGAPVAAKINIFDCQSFVLDYTAYTNKLQVTNDMMLEVVNKSIDLLNENADEWYIVTSRMYLCGFSAGGHVAALAVNRYSDDIDLVILGYAALDLKQNTIDTANLDKGFDGDLLAILKLFTVKPIDSVSAKTPRTFLWHMFGDAQVSVVSSYEYVQKLVEEGVPCEGHVYQRGKHGISLTSRASAKSPENIDAQIASWVQLVGEWIYH